MYRLIVVYNPNSSQYVHIEKEVLPRLRQLKGFILGKFAIQKTRFETNVKALKAFLQDHDIIVAIGGDATAAVAANAILESKKDITLAVLPYGNFNDLARTLGTMKYEDVFDNLIRTGDDRRGKSAGPVQKNVKKLYPLDVIVDGKHWRYATCYVTIGMTAEAVELFDKPEIRARMQEGHKSSWRSYLWLAKWYFKNRHQKQFLPAFSLNGKPTHPQTSDYAAVNGRSMSRIMKGGSDYLLPRTFRSETERTISFPHLFILMAKSIIHRVPGHDTKGDSLVFEAPATVEIQAEGEYRAFRNAKHIEIKKSGQFIKVIHK